MTEALAMCGDEEGRGTWGVVWALGLIHAVIDAACAALLAGQGAADAPGGSEATWSLPGITVWNVFFLYTVIAFGTQFAIGAMADRWRIYRVTALSGLAMLIAAVAIGHTALQLAILLAALGNAAFHVGAGAMVLTRSPDRAALAGIFVAPGAVGLAAGTWCGKSIDFWPWVGLGLLAVSSALVWFLPGRREEPVRRQPRPLPIAGWVAGICVAALLLSIVFRSAVGLAARDFHSDEVGVLWGLAIAAFAGKMLGGLAADRWGWTRAGVVTLLLSAPLLSVFLNNVPSALIGTLLFQTTMPITLMAVYRFVPREPGLAFGLTSLALLIGAVPMLVRAGGWNDPRPALAILVLLSVPALVIGLRPIARVCRPG
jgi:MFS transporter, FSR family, fosmidomycin resistance protein